MGLGGWWFCWFLFLLFFNESYSFVHWVTFCGGVTMANGDGSVFIGTFITCIIALLFAQDVHQIAGDIANNTTGLASTLYGYVGVFYALILIAIMAGTAMKAMRSR